MLAVDANTAAALPLTWWSLIGLIIPVIVAISVKYRDNSQPLYAIVAIVAAALAATLQGVLDDIPQHNFPTIFALFLGQFIPAIASYLGFWQPVVKINERAAPNSGFAAPEARNPNV